MKGIKKTKKSRMVWDEMHQVRVEQRSSKPWGPCGHEMRAQRLAWGRGRLRLLCSLTSFLSSHPHVHPDLVCSPMRAFGLLIGWCHQEWRPRYGYKRANDMSAVPWLEVPANAGACLAFRNQKERQGETRRDTEKERKRGKREGGEREREKGRKTERQTDTHTHFVLLPVPMVCAGG